MNKQKVLLKCAQEPVSLETNSIEYAPAGRHTVYASLNYEPGVVTVLVDENAANFLNEPLKSWIEEAEKGKVSRPFIDFDHEGKMAAAIPVKFFWDDGIRLEVEWTDAGREAIEGRNYSYFSPEMMVDWETGQILGLPNSGAIGSLVNTPAFQNIERLAAASSQLNQQNRNMENEELQQQLIAAEVKVVATEKDKATLQASYNSVVKERDSLTSERDTLVTERDKLKNKNATLQASAEKIRKEKISAQIEAKGIKEENREAVLKACLTQEDDGAKLLAAYEAPISGGIPPVNKGKKTEVKTGISRVAAAFAQSTN